jgi:hypothetical protein
MLHIDSNKKTTAQKHIKKVLPKKGIAKDPGGPCKPS